MHQNAGNDCVLGRETQLREANCPGCFEGAETRNTVNRERRCELDTHYAKKDGKESEFRHRVTERIHDSQYKEIVAAELREPHHH